jgi:hypothetical protein
MSTLSIVGSSELLQKHIDDLDKRTKHLSTLAEIDCHLAQHNLRLVRHGERRTHYAYVTLPGWTKRRMFFVKQLATGYEL